MQDQELKWWHVRWRLAGRAISRFAIVSGKIIGSLCLIAAIGYSALYLMSPWLSAKRMSKVDPRLSLVPANLPTNAESPLSNASIDCYGIRLSLPSESVVDVFQGDWITSVRFRNGGILMVEDTSHNPGWLGIAIGERNTQRLFGKEVLSSKFKLMQAAMWATPDQAKWWRLRALENQRIEYLLVAKFFLLAVPSRYGFTLGPIYKIDGGEFRGFQIGNPSVAPYEAHLDLFDRDDRHLKFDIEGPEGHGQVLTQADINGMVASIRPASSR
ncbi:MAG: hypothetical protein ABSD70_05415 [Terracidiphilus sp.]